MAALAVSVLMPVHNGGHFLRPALESLRVQTLADFEILAVDDGSTDDTPAILAAWPDPRLRVLTLPENRGEAAARNHGLAAARAPYVALLDADDLAYPERLARQAAFLDTHPEIGLLGTDCDVISAEPGPHAPIDSPRDDATLRWQSLFGHAFVHSVLMFRRELFTARGVAYSAEFPVATDYDWFTRALAATRAATLPARLGAYRRHPASFMRRHADALPDALAVLAHRHLAREFPSLAPHVSVQQLRDLHRMFAARRAPGEKLPLAAMRRAAALQADLHAAFAARASTRAP
ncbi:MAG: glycosyltransferase [Opitutaceae bacterium]|jgi:glycosyltransferase involved in cell wall biosynthesis|nr:glycosyltransferase [Opitutaceae bacterium]